jgi:hypothetical protein
MPNGWANASEDAEALHQKTKLGQTIHADFKLTRHPLFHRKFFALLKLAFDSWEPGKISNKYGVPEKNFKRFRNDLVILAGYYKVVIRLDGSTMIEPESISFANMDQDKFEKLYSAMIDTILKRIPKLGRTRKEIDDLVAKILSFV